jgi:tellurite resistance-related uncharacterized protein
MARADLPEGLTLARTTPVFDESTVPAGLLAAHQVAKDVWGRVIVESGELEFVFEDDSSDVRHLVAGERQVIPPQRPHHVQVVGPVNFCIEFHR